VTDDVLTKEHLEAAMAEMLVNRRTHADHWIGPRWAVDILTSREHQGLAGEHVGDCADCKRAWSVMVRS